MATEQRGWLANRSGGSCTSPPSPRLRRPSTLAASPRRFTKQFNIGEEEPHTKKIKQWQCSRADGEPVAIAVIYSVWELVQGPLRAFPMVTTESSPPLAAKDGRMPALLRNEDEVAMWLGETGASGAELKALLRPHDGSLVMREQDGPKPKGAKPPPKPKKPKTDPQPSLL